MNNYLSYSVSRFCFYLPKQEQTPGGGGGGGGEEEGTPNVKEVKEKKKFSVSV